MKGPDALVVDVQEGEIVQRLQDEMRGIVEDVGARMIANLRQEALEGRSVVEILSRVQLEADVDSGLVIGIEDRLPAPPQFRERLLDQTARPLRPGIDIGPGQCPGEAGVGCKPEPARCLGRPASLRASPTRCGAAEFPLTASGAKPSNNSS